jgi:putative phage-type endonuclease
MPISNAQREERRLTIGSSDISAILNCDPFGRNAADCYWEKVAGTEDKQTPAMKVGNLLEVVIVDYAAMTLGVEVARAVRVVSDENPYFAANLDAVIKESPLRRHIEGKYTSQGDDWGEEWTDQIPEHVMWQAQQQMYCAKTEETVVSAFIIGRRGEFKLYRAERNDALIKHLVVEGTRFMEEHVLKGIPPEKVEPSLETMKRLRREPASEIDFDEEGAALWASLEKAKEEFSHWETTKEQRQAALLAKFGTAESARLPDGRLLTYLKQKGAKRIDADQLRMLADEDVYKKCLRQSEYRVLRIKKR